MAIFTLNMYTSKIIEDIAQEVLDLTHAFENYTNVSKISNALGLKVIPALFNDNNIAGMLVYNDQEKAIYVNSTEIKERQRFTIAHEIGHFILHNELIQANKQNIFYRGDDNSSKPEEKQANQFAASLLMPKKELERTLNSFEKIHVEPIAEIFKVSKQMAYFRLVNLGLI
ncbi:MAG TPA: ImmA/IrrE family metallo-endopeptidase [Candidatus Gastranaerophilales bacterium]|nr:ImmA/IrrE family metallo-endopeptidase [Candidatus Gastranaerophilales bacterium]